MTPAEAAAVIAKLSPPPPPGSPYGVPVSDTEASNRTAVYRHWRFRDSPLLETLDPALSTFHALFENTAKYRASSKFLGWRPWDPATRTWGKRYIWMSYAEGAERRKNFGAGLVELHHRIGVTEDKYGVGVWAQNRPEWQLAELGIVSQSLWTVSLYETLGPEASKYIINHCKLACVISSLPHIATLLQLAPHIPSLRLIISLDPLEAGEPAGYSKLALLSQLAKDRNIQIFSMDGVEAIGAASGRPMRPPGSDDLITINYTSGTTGSPKGAVLTHGNMAAAVAAVLCMGEFGPDDVHLSYLPLAHIYGRIADQMVISAGACIGYFHGDVLGLVEDMRLLRPTTFMSVPRLYNRFSTTLQTKTINAPGFTGWLSNRAIAAKKALMQLPLGRATNRHLVYDSIWTPRVRRIIGLDRARSMISGSAQLSPDVHEFLRATFANNFYQGWGMTETYSVGTMQMRGDFTTGNIGGPNPAVELCIESAPELGYCVTDKPRPRGELLARGPVLFKEYYRDPEETRRALDGDGWLRTGDIAEVDELGRFRIIDRRKNMFKLAQGEYISPERIENVYIGSCRLVAAAYVHGDGAESTLVAVFGVDPEHFAPFAGRLLGEEIAPTDVQAIRAAAQHPRVKKAFLEQIDDIGKGHSFNSYERVRNCFLDVDPFTMENGLLTPTLKLKRPETAKAFRSTINEMYAEIRAKSSSKV